MRQFFKYVLATMTGLILLQVVVLLLVLAVVAGSSGSKPEIKNNSILMVDLTVPITDKGETSPLSSLRNGIFGDGDDKLSLLEVRRAIRRAASDDRIKALYLEGPNIRMGTAASRELRAELERFRDSGKPIYAHGAVYSEGAYYLASVANKIYLAPTGLVELNGLSSQSPYLKSMFEKLEVKPEIFRVGKFKSAIEPFILDQASEENKMQTREYLEGLYGQMIEDMAASRRMTPARLRTISDSMLARNAASCLRYGLVDGLTYYDQVEDSLRALTETKADKRVPLVSLASYIDQLDDKDLDRPVGVKDRIAVVYAEGDISSGRNSDGIGSDELTATLRKVRRDERVKAVVLRVNSPGGDAIASDLIWREVGKLREKGIPVIASMGNVAASGGYYIAMGADKILCEPTTITGSIGVFGMFFNTEQFWRNKTGIRFDGVKTGNFSDWPNPTRPFTPAERSAMQQFVDEIYADFTQKAAQGRSMEVNRLRELAQGRVYAGKDAVRLGLVDQLGGLDSAVSLAARMAKLDAGQYRLYTLPETKDPIEAFMENFSKSDPEKKVLEQVLGPDMARLAQDVRKLQTMHGVQARLLERVELR